MIYFRPYASRNSKREERYNERKRKAVLAACAGQRVRPFGIVPRLRQIVRLHTRARKHLHKSVYCMFLRL